MSRIGPISAVLIFAGLFAWVAIVLFAMANFNKFRVRLELQYPEIWKALGSPGFTNDKDKRWLIAKFLVSRRYRELNDPVLTKLGNRALLGQAFMLLIIVSFGRWWMELRL